MSAPVGHDRRLTTLVDVGGVAVGSVVPIVVQSMTNTDTADADATALQVAALAHAGSELVRVTVNNDAAARAVPEIRRKLDDLGIGVPLVGDFHYNGHKLLTEHQAAAAALAKYRINPGNVGSKRRDEHFATIIRVAIEHHKPVRIGVNWGSLDQDLLTSLMDENARQPVPLDARDVTIEAMIASAIRSAELAEATGLGHDRIILSAKVSGVRDLVTVYRELARRCDYPLHLGLTEAGMGMKGTVASTAALAILLADGIGDTIRVSLTPQPGGDRAEEVRVAMQVLQSLGLRSFRPQVSACPGCGRTTSTFFVEMAQRIDEHIAARMPAWASSFPETGVEDMRVAVMGCVVNGPGESRHADIGISLPGTFEEPVAPVFIDGELDRTLRGEDLVDEFIAILDDYVEHRYGRIDRRHGGVSVGPLLTVVRYDRASPSRTRGGSVSESGFVSSITRQSEDFPGWYNDVVLKAELADYSPVRGCMIIRPYGYAIWESMRDELDRYIKRTGHSNVYFPLFVPRSLLEKEAEHVEGFNPQVAWVTHAGGEELTEWLAIRPTSETIIAEAVKDWVQSYRDLPLLMNLWNNVVRWELRTRLFLRTAEFLWQEAHTFHATEEEAAEEVATGLEGYRKVSEEWLAIPVIQGRKSPAETFPGAVYTHAVEAMMRDRKALQAGTSHMLGTNFARAAGIEFLDRDNQRQNPWGTSWGFSTRMVGATIMAHGDDSGLVLPPNVAPVQVVVVPIFRSEDDRIAVAAAVEQVERAAADVQTRSGPLRLKVDWREGTPGFKYNHWELRGVPLRLEIGPRDVAAGQATVVRRLDRSKEAIPLDALTTELPRRLEAYQADVFARALSFRDEHTRSVDTIAEMREILDSEGGFLMAPWCGSADCERTASTETGASIRVIPFDSPDEPGACVADGRPSERRVLFARAY